MSTASSARYRFGNGGRLTSAVTSEQSLGTANFDTSGIVTSSVILTFVKRLALAEIEDRFKTMPLEVLEAIIEKRRRGWLDEWLDE